jgi:hypothetical protein
MRGTPGFAAVGVLFIEFSKVFIEKCRNFFTAMIFFTIFASK